MSKNEVIEIEKVQPRASNFPVTQEGVDALKEQRRLLMDFVRSQLREGIDNDYAVIPGTNKTSLLKPGAEKLARLFQLGVKMHMVDKELDRHGNFAMYTYRAEVSPLSNPDAIIAECEASCNSQEKKYRERSVWVKLPNQANKVKQTEITPICDILNTIQKMAQKRAMVGAVILAVSGSDFFTQDIETAEDAAALGINQPEEKPKLKVAIPTATGAASQNEAASATAPACCGKAMMVSKFADPAFGDTTPWYCMTCKTKKARQ